MHDFFVGTAKTDITPDLGSLLVGGLNPYVSDSVATPLYIKAMVINNGMQKLGIVTLDTLKYPVSGELIAEASEKTGIPEKNIIITSSHTHSAPFYTDYGDGFEKTIVSTLIAANNDLSHCTIGVSKGKTSGLIHNRRVMKEGHCWNTWLLPKEERHLWPPAGALDEDVNVLSFMSDNGKYKAVLFNFACHACTSGTEPTKISADYPGYARKYIDDLLGYPTETFFLPGACGDINGLKNSEAIGKEIAETIIGSLRFAFDISSSELKAISLEVELADRDIASFKEDEVELIWKDGLDHFTKSFEETQQLKKKSYKARLSGIRIGDDVVLITNPTELFVDIGLAIKEKSPFKYTFVVEQTNGALGYLPTAKAFEQGGYESFYGEHSNLEIAAGDIVFNKSMEILNGLSDEGEIRQ